MINTSDKQLLDSLAQTQNIVSSSHHVIQELSKRLSDHLLKQEVEEILSYYDEDAEFLETDAPFCRGIDALRIYYSTMKTLGSTIISRRPTELQTLSLLTVIERGIYNLQRSKRKVVHGRYFTLWNNRTTWKILQDCRTIPPPKCMTLEKTDEFTTEVYDDFGTR